MIKSNHLNCLPYTEAKALMDIPKSYNKNLQWKPANNRNYVTCQFIPYDERDPIIKGTLTGVSVQLDYKRPKRIKREKTVLTLFQQKNGVKYRAYQLEAAHEDNKSSRDNDEDIYGCHEHIGEKLQQVGQEYPIDDVVNWFKLFCKKIKLNFTGNIPQYSLVEHNDEL
ncbi:hypothetical protein [Rodentibacter pneumotropicus]|uniref:Uncharacterized protein n=1 Tax=Rodentibacter pneumotropicus TaxID=758 RepID=A0A4S2Q3Y3_9PAST|nr:hypothetical protein [Rodentibacter pneumotropicus]THA11303.1 hypothetical protein D3M78_00365 [Rodentibacter pneumotropicus]